MYLKERNEMADGKFYSLFKSLPNAFVDSQKEMRAGEEGYKIYQELINSGYKIDFYKGYMNKFCEPYKPDYSGDEYAQKFRPKICWKKSIRDESYKEVFRNLQKCDDEIVGDFICSIICAVRHTSGCHIGIGEGQMRDYIGICLKILDKKIEEKQK